METTSSSESISVAALNRAVAGVLARGFPVVRVHGEVANFTRAASGHWYFTLKDESAQVRCVMFRGRNALVGFQPREGDALELTAQVTLYEARGEYQLNVESAQRFGLGRLFEEFLRLKAQLAAQGVFDETRKRALPRLPQRIGVITSLQAAALRDVLSALQRRAPYVRVIVYPVPVQGAGAGQHIADMLARVSQRAEVDVALLVRGGGSIEDLWAFNEAAVAHAIRACRMPVVVGVGHESDFTIADFAADVRAPTPTAAAEIAAPELEVLFGALHLAFDRIARQIQQRLDRWQQRLDYAQRALAAPRAPAQALQGRLALLTQCLSSRLRAQLMQAQARHALLERDRLNARANLFAQPRARLAHATGALAQLDPHAVLARGYSVVRDAAGAIVRDAAQLAPRASIDITLARGGLSARVETLRGNNQQTAD